MLASSWTDRLTVQTVFLKFGTRLCQHDASTPSPISAIKDCWRRTGSIVCFLQQLSLALSLHSHDFGTPLVLWDCEVTGQPVQRTVTGSSPGSPPYLACEAPDSHSVKLKILKIDDVSCSTAWECLGHGEFRELLPSCLDRGRNAWITKARSRRRPDRPKWPRSAKDGFSWGNSLSIV